MTVKLQDTWTGEVYEVKNVEKAYITENGLNTVIHTTLNGRAVYETYIGQIIAFY